MTTPSQSPEKSTDEIALNIIHYANFEGTAPIHIGILTTEIVEALDFERAKRQEAEKELEAVKAIWSDRLEDKQSQLESAVLAERENHKKEYICEKR